MSARPGRIRELIPSDMPRPRDPTSPLFNDYKRRILSLLRADSATPAAPEGIVETGSPAPLAALPGVARIPDVAQQH
jgi:hypothetical protein